MISNRELFLRHVAQTSTAPLMLEIQEAKGVYLFGKSGKKYLDMISGISVSSLGHGHPEIVEAVKHQAEKFMHLMVYGEYAQYPQSELAHLLSENLPASLNSCYFVNSGAEATEGAMKLAKKVTGRSEIIYCKSSYHGSSQGALSIMGDEYFKQNFRPLLPDCKMIEYGNSSDIEKISKKTACIFIEPVQAESGVTVPPEEYLQSIRKKCDETGALLVFDEIQTGMGRTGTLFAFEQSGVVPDILLLAKALGGGMPIGTFIASKNLMDNFTDNPVLGHITTFGGHPVSCAAAKASLKVILREKLWENALRLEALFKKELKHQKIVSFRSKGALMAIEFESEKFNRDVISKCIESGLITDWFLFAPHCLRLAPPLIMDLETAKKASQIILQAIEETALNEKTA
ncbi:MAG: aspartate aminotransferase family protein [Chitinophagaceae bacterium]|nr:MAG: aspartate aminotransferase family protein [Chitinophagaceae bacterium]